MWHRRTLKTHNFPDVVPVGYPRLHSLGQTPCLEECGEASMSDHAAEAEAIAIYGLGTRWECLPLDHSDS